MKAAFLVVGLCLGLSLQAQHFSRIDSLKSHLQDDDDEIKINLLYEIAWEYRNSTPDSTIKYSLKALDLSRDLNKPEYQSKAFNFIGIAYHYKGDYVNSFDYLSKAMELSIHLKDSLQYAHSLNTLGRLFMVQGDLVKSYNYFWEAKEVFEKVNNKQGISYSYKSLAELYQNQDNIPKALEMLQKALAIRYEIGDDRGEISIHNELAQLYLSQMNYDQAFQYYLNAKTIAARIGDKISIAEINLGISGIYYDQAKYSEALIFVNQAKDLVEDTDNDDLRSRVFLQMGKVYLASNMLAEAQYYLTKVLSLTTESGDKNLMMQAYYHLHLKAEMEKNVSLAYQYFQKYFDLRKSLEDADKAREIERLEARLEIEKKERENELLMANQARDQAVIKQQQIEKLSLLIIALVITGFMVNLWFTAKKRRKDNLKLALQKEHIAAQKTEISNQNEQINKQNIKLQRHNDELKHLNDEKDNLMNIMAHDLKGPFNRIVGLVELTKMSDPNSDDTKKYLEMMKDVSLSGIALIRDLLDVHAFEADRRVMNYIKINLQEFIENKVKDYKAEIDAKSLHTEIQVEPQDYPFYTDEMYLSRILDNLLSNAIKFSHPESLILIRGYNDEKNIILSIKDQGQGFTAEDKENLYQKFKRLSARPTGGESSNGLGLAIVKVLVEQLNGEIELISEKNKGSEFIIKFPVKAQFAILA